MFLNPCDSECDCARMSYGHIACMVLKFPKLSILFSAARFESIVQNFVKYLDFF